VLEEGSSTDLFAEELAAEAAQKAALLAQQRAAVPGLLNPYSVQDDDDL
jgi:hypothetical protein